MKLKQYVIELVYQLFICLTKIPLVKYKNRLHHGILLPQNVNTQQELPTGAPNRRSLTGASVSCQVHHKNLAPIMTQTK